MKEYEISDIVIKDINKCVKFVDKELKKKRDEKVYGKPSDYMKALYSDTIWEAVYNNKISNKSYDTLVALVFSFEKKKIEKAYIENRDTDLGWYACLMGLYEELIYDEVDKMFKINKNGTYTIKYNN
jgi:hypothetical protein